MALITCTDTRCTLCERRDGLYAYAGWPMRYNAFSHREMEDLECIIGCALNAFDDVHFERFMDLIDDAVRNHCEYIACHGFIYHVMELHNMVESSYDEYLAEHNNELVHSLNGNFDQEFQLDYDVYRFTSLGNKMRYHCLINLVESKIKDDLLLSQLSRTFDMTNFTFLRTACYVFVNKYALCPYLLCIKGKNRKNATEVFLQSAFDKFADSKDKSLNCSINRYIVKRLAWFSRNLNCFDEDGVEVDFGRDYYKSMSVKKCKKKKVDVATLQMWSAVDAINNAKNVVEALPKAEKLVDKVDTVLDKVLSAMNDFTNSTLFKAMKSVVEGPVHVIGAIKEFIDKSVDQILTVIGVDPGSKCANVIFSFIYCLLILLLIVSVGTLTTFIHELIKLSTRVFFGKYMWINKNDEIDLQSFGFKDPNSEFADSQMTASTLVGTLFTMGIYLCTGAKVGSPSFVRNCMSWGDVVGSFCVTFKSYINIAFKYITDIDLGLDDDEGSIPQLTEYLVELHDVCYDADLESKVAMDRDFARRVIDLHDRVGEFRKALLDPRFVKIYNQPIVNHVLAKLDNVYHMACTASPDVHDRIDADVIYLFGDAGKGKSTALEMLPEVVWKVLHSRDDLVRLDEKSGERIDYFKRDWDKTLVYARKSSDDYFSGYKHQPNIMFNEAFTAKDVTLRIKEAKEIIDVADRAAMPLNMASIDEKGLKYMTSRMCWVTTNIDIKDFHQLNLSKPSALVRRLTFPLEVLRLEDYDPIKENYDEAWGFKCVDISSIDPMWSQAAKQALNSSKLMPNTIYTFSEIVNLIVSSQVRKHFRTDGAQIRKIDWSKRIQNGVLINQNNNQQKLFKKVFDSPDLLAFSREEEEVVNLLDLFGDDADSSAASQMFNNVIHYWKGGEEMFPLGKIIHESVESSSEDEYVKSINIRACKILPCSTCINNHKHKGVSCHLPVMGDRQVATILSWMLHDRKWKSWFMHGLWSDKQIIGACEYVRACLEKDKVYSLSGTYCLCDTIVEDKKVGCVILRQPEKFTSFRFGKTPVSKQFLYTNNRFYVTHYENGKPVFSLDRFIADMRVAIVKKKLKYEYDHVNNSFTEFVSKSCTRIKKYYYECIQTMNVLYVEVVVDDGWKCIVRDVWDGFCKTVSDFVFVTAPTVSEFFSEKWKWVKDKLYLVKERIDSSNIVDQICSYVGENWHKILFVCGMLAFCGVAIMRVASMFEKERPRPEMQPFDTDDGSMNITAFMQSVGQSRYQKEIINAKKMPQVRYATSQMSVEGEMKRFKSMILENSRIIEINGEDGQCVETNIFFGHAKSGVVPRHAYVAIPKIKNLYIRSWDGNSGTYYTPDEFNVRVPSEKRDCVFFDFNMALVNVKSIVNRFFTKKKLFVSSCMRLMKARMDTTLGVYFNTGGRAHYREIDLTGKTVSPHGKEINSLMNGYYEVENGGGFDGACAFPFVSREVSDQNQCIMGIHVAQLRENSIICPVYQSDFLLNNSAISQSYSTYVPYPETFIEESESAPMPGTASYCKVKKPCGGMNKTALIRTQISSFLPKETDLQGPARLQPFTNEQGDLIKPLNLFYAKYGQYEARPKPKILSDLEKEPDLLFKSFEPMFEFKHEWWSIDDTILGNQDKGIDSMDRSTASGFPYRYEKTGKRGDWFRVKSIKEPNGWIDPKLRLDVELMIEGLRNGNFPISEVIDALKDELRDWARVKVGKTRVFCVGNLVLCIVCKMFFGPYLKRCKDMRSLGCSAVGVNPHSADWTFLGREIFKFGRDRVVGGDLPTQDITIQRYMGACAFKYFNYRMNIIIKEDLNVLEGLCYAMVTALHITAGWTYIHEKGNSSGQWMTSWFATFCTHIWMKCCFYHLRPKGDDRLYEQLVVQSEYGDDNLGSVSEECDFFDNLSIAHALKDVFDLSFTDPRKGEIKDKWLGVEDQIFLARTFVEKDGEYLAPLARDSLFGMLHFIRHHDGLDDTGQLVQNVDVFASEMSHYSVEEGNALWEIVMDAMRKSGIPYSGRDPAYWRPRRHEIAWQCYERR